MLNNQELSSLVRELAQKQVELEQRIAELEGKKTRARFTPPTLEEVKAYMFEKGCMDAPGEGQRFYDFYESNGWKVGKNKMKNWKASASGWLSRNKQQPQMFANDAISQEKLERQKIRAALRNIHDTSRF